MSEREFTLYPETACGSGAPIVIFHGFRDEAETVRREMENFGCPPCVLAAVRIADWEQTLSPWEAPRVFRGADDFGSGADRYIEELTGEILPAVRRQSGSEGPCFIAGYSFAGLFALYSLYRTDAFSGAVSASGSLWFPGFAEFAMSHPFCGHPERLYLSLGDRESHTRNEVMRTVGERTELLYRYYQCLGISCTFELNPGNHFQDPEKRMARGITRILQRDS